MRAPAQLARAGMAGQAPSPPTSPLAPAAQVSRSPLWLKSRARYCGSILAPVALLWPASGSAQLPLVMGVQPGCVLVCRIAGPYRHCRPRWAQWGGLGPGLPYVDRRLHRLSGARRQSEPALSCARNGWDVTVWRTVSAARLRQPRGHRAVRGHPDSFSLAPLWLHDRPCLAYGARARARAVPGSTYAGRVSRGLVHRALSATAMPPFATSPGQRPFPLSSGRPLQTRMGPGEPDLAATATRGHDTPRPEP